MSDVRGFMEVSALTVTADETLTLIQLLAGTNHPIKILGWSVGFNSVAAADEPIACQLLIQTTAGTAAGSTTVRQRDRTQSVTFDTTGKVGDYSAEPTPSDQFPVKMVHPSSGYEIWYPEGKEITVATVERIGLRVISGALNASLDQVSASIDFEE